MEVEMFPPSNVIEFKSVDPVPDAKPLFAQASWTAKQNCTHDGATFLVSTMNNSVTCSLCERPIEAIAVLKRLLDSEYKKARRDNADAWHRQHAEEEAERQAKKTRKAAYATLFRFGVTPEAYAEEYRRNGLREDLLLKQDSNQSIVFEKNA